MTLFILRSFCLLLFLTFNQPEIMAQYQINDKIQDFKLKDTHDKWVSLKDFKNVKGYIVVFTCNHCPYANLYEERIKALDKKYKPKGYPVVAINPNDKNKVPEDSFEAMKKRAEEYQYSFPYLHDESQAIAKAFGASRTPQVFLVDKNLVLRYIGAIDDDTENINEQKQLYVEDAIQQLDAGKQPKVTETKAIGCTIKWKDA